MLYELTLDDLLALVDRLAATVAQQATFHGSVRELLRLDARGDPLPAVKVPLSVPAVHSDPQVDESVSPIDAVADDERVEIGALKKLLADGKRLHMTGNDEYMRKLMQCVKMADKLGAIAEHIVATKVRTR